MLLRRYLNAQSNFTLEKRLWSVGFDCLVSLWGIWAWPLQPLKFRLCLWYSAKGNTLALNRSFHRYVFSETVWLSFYVKRELLSDSELTVKCTVMSRLISVLHENPVLYLFGKNIFSQTTIVRYWYLSLAYLIELLSLKQTMFKSTKIIQAIFIKSFSFNMDTFIILQANIIRDAQSKIQN